MNSPLIPQGSNLEQQSKARSSLKVKIFCAIGVNVAVLLVLLMQGCKREQPPVETAVTDPYTTIADTNPVASYESSNQPVTDPGFETGATGMTTIPQEQLSQPTTPTVPLVTAPPAAGTEYKIEKGDSFYTIGKKFGVSMAALKAANPSVDPNKLQIGKTIVVPAPTAATAPVAGGPVVDAGTGSTVHKVKSGETLGKLATQYGTTVKAIQAANNLSDTKIKVGQELKIPAKR